MAGSYVAAVGGTGGGTGAGVASVIVVRSGLAGTAGLHGDLRQTDFILVAVVNVPTTHLRDGGSCRAGVWKSGQLSSECGRERRQRNEEESIHENFSSW